jgi:hypothetical protein
LWLFFVPKLLVFDDFSAWLVIGSTLPERHGDSAMRMRFWCESSARPGENLCDTVVANFLFVDQRLPPRAFHTKARSHCTITTPLGQLGLLL